MTAMDTATGLPRPSFGVGARMNDTFSIFFGRFALFGVVGIVAGLLMQLPTYLAFGAEALDAVGSGASEQLIAENPIGFVILALVVPLLVYSLLTAILVLAAYDAKAGRDANVGSYVATTLRCILPLVVMSIVAWLLIGIGFALLLIPGLWLLGVLAVFVPVIVIESKGFACLGRSADLTKGYRWPIVGFTVLIYVIFYVVTMVIAGVGAFLSAGTPIVFLILQGIAGGLSAALASVAVAVTYARLREIKDGVGFSDLADVFG